MKVNHLVCALLVAGCGGGQKSVTPTPPEPVAVAEAPPPAPASRVNTRRDEVVDTVHGVAIADPYRWLEKADDPAVKEWLAQQDHAARTVLASLPGRDKLQARLTQLTYIDSMTAPWHEGKRYFYTRSHADKEKAIYYWREGAKENVLLDPNGMSADGSVAIKGWSPSPDGRYVAWRRSNNNADHATVFVRDVAAGKDLPDEITGGRYAAPSWTKDAKGFYYTWIPTDPAIPVSELPGKQMVKYHRLGTDPAKDEVVFPALDDPTRFIGAQVSRDGRWLTLVVWKGSRANDIYFRDLRAKPRPPRKEATPFEARGFQPLVTGQDAIYGVSVWKDRFYVSTNEGAPRYRVFVVDPKKPERAAWKEIVAEPGAEARITSASVIGGHLVVSYLRNVVSAIEIRKLDGKLVREVALPGIGTTSSVSGRPDEDTGYFTFSSPTHMPQIWKLSTKTGKVELWEQIEYPADLTPYVTTQVRYPSKDGTQVPMFIVHRKDLVKNGDNPVLLTGYGGFNVNMVANFASSWVVWLEQGGVIAMPNLRGGGELGEEWHRAGMLGNKQNVFDDYIAAAEWLIKEKYTRPQRLAISGGSNGGLLVGAAMVQRPELFGAVVCSVPLIDMVRYHLSGSGKTWTEEYGSAEDPEQFRYLHAYSPYHHVKQGVAYPPMLMLTADSDDRVDPLHARKFSAMIQWATDQPESVLVRVETNAGHNGGDLRKKSVAEKADYYAWLMKTLGMTAR